MARVLSYADAPLSGVAGSDFIVQQADGLKSGGRCKGSSFLFNGAPALDVADPTQLSFIKPRSFAASRNRDLSFIAPAPGAAPAGAPVAAPAAPVAAAPAAAPVPVAAAP